MRLPLLARASISCSLPCLRATTVAVLRSRVNPVARLDLNMTKSSTPQQIASKSILKVILSGPLIGVQSDNHTYGNGNAPPFIEERRILLELLDQRLLPDAGRGAGAAGRGAGAAGFAAGAAGLLTETLVFDVFWLLLITVWLMVTFLLTVTLVVRPGV